MWKFKPFMHKEPVGLEGRCIDVGNLKIIVQNAIAEGGFSCVYLTRDAANGSKQYALKHMICNDEESMELVMKEINVMKSLKGHPNIVTLHAHTILDMGRRKEALLVMEFCEKSLVNALEARGAGYFEEKQCLSIFRDACNAVFAMHSQFPPIAHRDLKPENLLLGPDGLWKLCDFGSTTTNHKRFEKPEEMGIEEDNIRKHTTPAFRAPEMWDLFRRDVISEKVDIWALGCLLFRICYFKNAFDGESKLQILNGNYRIPELPKYSASMVELIRDMLQASPEDRPDITQVWFRVNELLPVSLQKSLPNTLPEMQSVGVHEGFSKSTNRSPPMPQRNPPPPPSSGVNRSPPMPQRSPPPPPSSGVGGVGGQLGAFWATLHAKESAVEYENRPKFDEEPSHDTLKEDWIQPENHTVTQRTAIAKEQNIQTRVTKSNFHSKLHGQGGGTSKDFEISFSQNEREHGMERLKASKTESTSLFQDDAFNSFVADFDSSKLNSTINNKPEKEEALEAEIERLKEQLKQVNAEKSEITSKFEKLSSICRSQRQEIQELKQAVAAKISPDRCQVSPQTFRTLDEKSEWGTPSPEAKSWQAFADDIKPQHQPLSKGNSPQSVRTRTPEQKRQNSRSSSDFNSWGFGTDNFSAVPVASSPISRPVSEGSNSQLLNGQKIRESQPTSQPAGWAGF